MARGNARQNIFLCQEDWESFLDILSEIKATRPFRLYAYCLMSNHLHLLIEPASCTISALMNVLLSRYAKRLNRRLGRTGHVFQERFRAPFCLKDSHFQELVRYIHLNPVRAGIAVEPSAWPYSGHHEYLGRGPRRLVDQGLLLSMFNEDIGLARAAYQRFVFDTLAADPSKTTSIPPRVPPAPIVGYARISSELIDIAPQRTDLEDLLAACASTAGIPVNLLQSPAKVHRVCRARREFIKTALMAGYTATEIAARLRLSLAAVSKALSASR